MIFTTERKEKGASIHAPRAHCCMKGACIRVELQRENPTFNEAFLLQRLQRRPLQDQLLQPGLHSLPLRVLQVGRRAGDCRGRTGGGGGREGGGRGGQCGAFGCGAGEKMSRDGGEDEKRQGRPTAEVGED